MTIGVEHFIVGEFNGSGASPSSSNVGTITTDGTNRLICIAVISGRANTGTDYQTCTAISASGLTFTHKLSQQWTYSDSAADASFPVNSFTIDIFTAPASAQQTALAWTSTMSGDGFVNHGTAIVWAVNNLGNIAAPYDTYDPIYHPEYPVGNANYVTTSGGVTINTGSGGNPTVTVSGDEAQDAFLNLYVSHTTGGTQATPVADAAWSPLIEHKNTTGAGSGTNHAVVLQYRVYALPQTHTAQPTGYTDSTWIAVSLEFTAANLAANIRASQLSAEVLNTGVAANIRATQLSAEVLNTGVAANIRASQLAIEVLSAAVTPTVPGPNGDLLVTEAPDTFAAAGYQPVIGTMLVTEAQDTFSAFVKLPLTAMLAVTEAQDSFQATGVGLGEDGRFIITEAQDTFAATVFTPPIGQLLITEAQDSFRALGPDAVRLRPRRPFFVS